MTAARTNPDLGRWALATLVAGAAYILAYVNNFTPFYYFPMVNEWHWQPQSADIGPGITYFAWKSVGLLAGACSLLLPRRWTNRLPADTVWVGGLLLSVIVCVHESYWFVK